MGNRLPPRIRPATWIPTSLAILLALGWGMREAALALKRRRGSLADGDARQGRNEGVPVPGSAGRQGRALCGGDTPASTQFVTGRFVLRPARRPMRLIRMRRKRS